ncbi:MAG TPA: NUDIX hydrolase [Pirellulales bacterium]|nr:NUDIX hydrolase [Pirellulales bacterium]
MNQLDSEAFALQACAIPFRQQARQFEFCLITSLNKGRWGFPKGTIDPGETYPETALKEAYEEAGLRGEIVGTPLGSYEYAKWGGQLRVTVVMMRVSEVLEHWLEARQRKRAWCSAEEARVRVANADQRRLLEQAIQRLAAMPAAEF